MQYRHFAPIPALAPFIDCFWTLESSGRPGEAPTSIMPGDARGQLLLSFAGTTRMTNARGRQFEFSSGGSLLGPHEDRFVLEHTGDTCLVATQFRPGGLAAFLPLSVSRLSSSEAPLDALWRDSTMLWEQVAEADTAAGKVQLLQQFLLSKRRDDPNAARISHALHLIGRSRQGFVVGRLAEEVNLSQKQLERVFEANVGILPKRYSRLSRFQGMVSALQTRSRFQDWSSLAAEFGFYDHSHMVKDFHAFAGVSPGRFLAATAGVVEIVYGSSRDLRDV